MKRYWSIGISVIIALCLYAGFVRAVEPLKETVTHKQAQSFKQQGDKMAEETDFAGAAGAYENALGDRSQFSESERLTMAKVLAWGGRLEASAKELGLIVVASPNNVDAKVLLSQVYYWQGKSDEALPLVEEVLRKDPSNRSALRLKADILRATDPSAAVAIYQGLLAKSEDFDARVGLAHAYVQAGQLTEAREETSKLVPAYPYQKQEVQKIKDVIDTAEMKSKEASVVIPPQPAKDPAVVHKEAGDRLAEQGNGAAALKHTLEAIDLRRAASREYLLALGHSRSFSVEDRLHMATVMSWAGMLKQSRHELEAILQESPKETQARIQLARVLSWQGEVDNSLKQIDIILSYDPENRDALFVKANDLRRTGQYRKSEELYAKLLHQNEDNDGRDSLTYSYIYSGNRVAADRNIALLKPISADQEVSYAELVDSRDQAFDPSIYTGITYYSDSDHNRVTRSLAGGTVWVGNWKTSLEYQHIVATDPSRTVATNELALSTYARMPFYGGVGGGVGLADDAHIMTWNGRADIDLLRGSAGVSISKEVVTDTAQTLENRIRVLNVNGSISQNLTDRISVSGNYSHREYSDSNSANDIQLSASYKLNHTPVITVGYRFRYLDYRRQSFSGYFDPNDYVSNALFANISYENKHGIYGYAEPYGGYQDYKRYGVSNNSLFGGASALIGYHVTNHFGVELNAEGGNYAAATANGFTYYQIGGKMVVRF